MLGRHNANLAANSGLARLFLAQAPADFSDWLDFVAVLSLLAFVWQAPPVAFATMAVVTGLPYLTVGLVAGSLTDRMDLAALRFGQVTPPPP